MSKFKINPLVLAIAVAMPSAVYAQDEAVDEIVVSGFRESLANALSLKKDAVGAVDSIVAEDIGDFPDNNLADAMARLPGVNIDRTGGEGKSISVRGLSAQFSRVRINGMETVATGYGNTGRAFDFNIFASELFSRIDVNKTMKAEMEEGSLGATVDLHTAHPLDSKKDTFMVNYTQGYNDLSKASDPRFTALGSMQNEDGTFGVAASVAVSKRSVTQQGHNSGRWEANALIDPTKTLSSQNNHWALVAPAKTAANLCSTTLLANCWKDAAFTMYQDTATGNTLNAAVHPRFARQMDREIDIDRVGFTGSVQWKPTEDTKLTLDVLDASLGFDQHDVNLTPISLARTGATGKAETSVLSGYVIDPASNAMVYAKLSGVDVRSENFNAETQTEFHQASLALEHNFTDSLSMKALYGSSKANTEVTHEATAILERFNAGFTYDYRTNPKDPTLVYDFDLTNPNSWKVSELRDRPNWTTNTFDNASVDFKWEINDTFSVQAGASAKKFTHDNIQLQRDTAIIDQAKLPQGSAVKLPAGCAITIANTAVDTFLGKVFTPSNGQNPFFLGDIGYVFDKMKFEDDAVCFPLKANVGSDRSVEEKSNGYFVQGNFTTDLMDMPFKGNVGVRTVTTDLSSTGVLSGADATVERSYSDTLPSVNLSLSPIDDVTVRASWAKVMSRPSLPNLTPGGSLDNFNRRYTAGNPFLDPFRADAIDLSVDWYFTEEGVVSLAYFKKDIESFTQSSTLTKKFSELGLPSSISPAPATADSDYIYSTTGNGEGGKLDGIELQYQQPFTFGPDWMRDFGIKLNYTKIDSELNVGTKAAPRWVKMAGQSDDSYNGTLWYENDSGLQGRISYTYRSGYITSSYTPSTAGGIGATTGFDTTDEVGVVDASFSYQFNEKLKFTLDLINLNNASETLLNGDAELVDTVLKSGRQAYLGASYTF